MRYNLESTLPINAFSPRGGRSPFARGMTLEGGDTFKPITNAVSSVAKGVTQAVKAVVQPVYNATLKQVPGVDNALVNLDKSVGKAIPGGWGTVASVAASFIPGAQLAALGMTQTGLATGLGALTGSGVMRGNHDFNLQGAIMGGAMAYGASELSQAFQNAGKSVAEGATDATTKSIANAADKTITPGSGYVPEGGMTQLAGTPAPAPTPPVPPPGAGYDYSAGYSPTGSDAVTQAYTPPPTMLERAGTAIQNIPSNIESGLTSLGKSATNFGESVGKVFDPATYNGLGGKLADVGSGTLDNMGNFASGVGKVIGGSASLPSGTLMGAGVPLVLGYSGMAALEEQQKYLDQQLASGNIAQDQYDAEKAKIEEQRAFAQKTVDANPLQASTDINTISNDSSLYNKASTPIYASRSTGDTLYDKDPSGGTKLLYAVGGSVDDEYGMDEARGIMSGNLQNGLFGGGIASLAAGGEVEGYFGGGIAKFLAAQEDARAQAAQQAAEQAAQQAAQQVGIDAVKANPLRVSEDMSRLNNLTNVSDTNTYYLNKPEQDFYDLHRNEKRSTYAQGGMAPRFLSGGGDGMSDSIKANINGRQEARLADGEFVVPADVVSHLGNGSSKAGAKQLYSMMDKVRTARTGRKSQGKQINPRKYLAA